MRLLAALLVVVAGCGGGKAFTISGDDNDPAALKLALAAREPARAAAPGAVLYAALAGGGLTAWDLDDGKPRWSVPARPASRVVVTEKFLVAREDAELVARAVADGSRLWAKPLPAGMSLLGLTADAERVYALVSDRRRSWMLLAFDEAGRELWREDSPGALGTPAAAGGLVYLPFLNQWLVLLDAKTGTRLTRLRQEDEAVSWVRATPDGVTFGARSVLLLDEGAASGRREAGRHVSARLPGFASLLMHLDAFDPAGAGYSALDRTRLLWRLAPGMRFAGDTVVLAASRYLFGFDVATGQARWARTLRSDAVSAEDTGGALVVVSQEGGVLALDRVSGRLLSERSLGKPVTGATVVAEGWRAPPLWPGDGEPPPKLVEALAEIALDRDARFGPVKLHAVAALAAVPEQPGAIQALVAIAVSGTAAPEVERAAGEALVGLRDPAATPILIHALAERADYAAGRTPRGVEVLARALAAIDPPPPAGAVALLAHLEDPATPPGTVQEIARALIDLRATPLLPRLASLLLLHRCDPRFVAPAASVAEAIAVLGGPAERELLAFVVDDPRTDPSLREQVRELLAGGPRR